MRKLGHFEEYVIHFSVTRIINGGAKLKQSIWGGSPFPKYPH